jgi:hypothetical protein
VVAWFLLPATQKQVVDVRTVDDRGTFNIPWLAIGAAGA